jgi:hypothetical protein
MGGELHICVVKVFLFSLKCDTIKIHFSPLENPVKDGGEDTHRIFIPYRKGGVKASFFLMGLSEGTV